MPLSIHIKRETPDRRALQDELLSIATAHCVAFIAGNLDLADSLLRQVRILTEELEKDVPAKH